MFASLEDDPRFQALLQRMEEARDRERSRGEQEGLFAVGDSVIAADFSR